MYTALVEPDFLATQDWHSGWTAELPYLERGARHVIEDWVYLKLFDYPRPQWSWNADDWLS